MISGTEPYIERAREHVKSKDPHRLRYACLELRYALELIAYHKLEFRLGKISPKDIRAWQPKQVMDTLMELVDEHMDVNFTLQIAEDSKAASEGKFSQFRKTKGVSPSKLGRHWQKIGSYLHVQMPKKKGDKPAEREVSKLMLYLENVIEYIEAITETGFDAYFSSGVEFDCVKCGQKIKRNKKLLESGTVVHCQNSNCDASYTTEIENGEFNFESNQLFIKCENCTSGIHFDANVFLKVKPGKPVTLECNRCKTCYTASWFFNVDFKSEDDRNKLWRH